MENFHGDAKKRQASIGKEKGAHKKEENNSKTAKAEKKVTSSAKQKEIKERKDPKSKKAGGTQQAEGISHGSLDKSPSCRALILSWDVARDPIDMTDLLKNDDNIGHCSYVALSPPTKDPDWTIPVDQSSIVIFYSSPKSEKPLYEMERYLEYCVGKKGSDKVIVVIGDSEMLDEKWINQWKKNPFAYNLKPVRITRADLDWITRREVLQEMQGKLDGLKMSLLGHTGHKKDPDGSRKRRTSTSQTPKSNEDKTKVQPGTTIYEEIKQTVGFFSWSKTMDSAWLQRLLTSQYFQLMVTYTDVLNTESGKVTEKVSAAPTLILYFTQETFLTFSSQTDIKIKFCLIPEQKKTIVVIDDLDGKSSEKRVREVYKKSSMGKTSADLFLFRKEEKETAYLTHLKRDQQHNIEAEKRWSLFQDLINTIVKLPDPPAPKLGIVGIFSKCFSTNYTWLETLLKSPKLRLSVDDVSSFHISGKGIEEALDCSFGVLYHSQRREEVSIVEEYEAEMEHLSATLGRFNVLVIIDDLKDSSWMKKEKILYSQPNIQKYARNLLLISKEEKKNEERLLAKLLDALFAPGLAATGTLDAPDFTLYESHIMKDDHKTLNAENIPAIAITMGNGRTQMERRNSGSPSHTNVQNNPRTSRTRNDPPIQVDKKSQMSLNLERDHSRPPTNEQTPQILPDGKKMETTNTGNDPKSELVDSAIEDIAESQKTNGNDHSEGAPLQLPPVQFVTTEHIHIDKTCKLGVGSFGIVYKGSYQGTAAAVKKLQLDDEDLSSIIHEIQISMRLHHPYIVKLMAAAKSDSCILLANEYIHGANLDSILHKPSCPVKLSEDDKIYASLEILLAVEYIHSQNIIHQDIKPVNILVEGKTKKTFLTDWGMANIRETVCTKRFKSRKVGPIGGTLLYKAPECVLEDNVPPTKMSDMWSVGVTFLEIFTQRKPWKTYNEMLKKMFHKETPQSLEVLSQKLQPIVKGCFDYKPNKRPTATRMVSGIKNMEGVDLVKHYGYTF
ncbi:uncharacterized protein [Pyxicephalus adspersus]|uniref:uncharacterized protein n=1 Tax=Pyxicephalus adspersus TaxID=30357 RepID=UPI003B5BB58D